MKAIVTGGAGFIGRNLCDTLSQLKWEVSVVDDYSSGHRANKLPTVMYYEDSILNSKFIDHLVYRTNPDVVFHLAAIPRVPY